MREKPATSKNSFLRKASIAMDPLIGLVSPRAALKRAQYRFAYDILDGHRTRKKRKSSSGTGDTHLDESTQADLREISRDMSRNNPIIKGMLLTERDGVVGPQVKLQARTSDKKFNEEAEAAFREIMALNKCDVTGTYNVNQFIRKAYLTYRRDGDFFVLFTDEGIQGIEGEQVGTPIGKTAKNFDIVNGIAVSKQTQRRIGYYIGKANKWGYIEDKSWKNYPADYVTHVFNADRFSHSRGEPALTSAMTWIDKVSGYVDAELVAAKINACFSMFVARKEPFELPDAYTDGVESSGAHPETSERYEKIEPGRVMYGSLGEEATGIGQMRPGNQFEAFVTRLLGFIGRPIGMPLMLITLDYSGATYMNARIAYQQIQRLWESEQEDVVKPLVARIWRWFIDKHIAAKTKAAPEDMYSHETICNRWPYVDPYKEAMADKVQLENRTTNRTLICARQNLEFDEVIETSAREAAAIKKQGLGSPAPEQKKENGETDNGK